MTSQDILAMKGGHKVITSGTAYTATDYNFYGFIPHADTVIGNLQIGSTDVTPTGITFAAGIYYGCPSGVNPGYYNAITITSGTVTLVLTQSSPNHY
jgi:hypothetical protein